MPLTPGTKLGQYEVAESIGAGGIPGEVYKAKDLKLRREVAVKVLPQEMAADAQPLRRIEQEARAASTLNHPNIVGASGLSREVDLRGCSIASQAVLFSKPRKESQ